MKTKTNRSLSSVSEGFTLIELLVVIVIVGVLGSIAAPGWLSYLNRQRVRSVQIDLKGILQQAQTKAQQRSTSYSIVLGSTPDGPTAALSTAGSVAIPTLLGSNTANIQLSEFVGTAAATDHLKFNYRGNVSDDSIPFVIKITSDNNAATQRCLIVASLLGGIVEAKDSKCDNPNFGT